MGEEVDVVVDDGVEEHCDDDEDVVVEDDVVDDVVVVALVVSGSRRRRRPRPFFGNGIDGIVTRDTTPRSQCVVDEVVVVAGGAVVVSSFHMIPWFSVDVMGKGSSRPRRFLTHFTSMSTLAHIE